MAVEFAEEIPPRRFDEILPEVCADSRIIIDPLDFPGLSERVAPLSEQAAYWAARVADRECDPVAVLAYCAGAAFANELVAALPGADTTLIVLDPVSLNADSAQQTLDQYLRELGDQQAPSMSTLPDQRALETAGRFLNDALARNLPDLDPAIATELLTVRRTWLSFVLSSAGADVGHAVGRQVHVVLSENAEWGGSESLPVHRIAESMAGLFRSPAVRDLLTDLMLPVGTG